MNASIVVNDCPVLIMKAKNEGALKNSMIFIELMSQRLELLP